MDKETSSAINSLGLILTFLTFLVLKLTHVINWSWWWITVPLWGGLAIALVLLIVYIFLKAAFKMGQESRDEEVKRYQPSYKSKFIEKLEQAQKESEIRNKAK